MEKQFEIERDDERLIVRWPVIGEVLDYGLPDRKEKDTYIPICFCPWCGSQLRSRFNPVTPNPVQTEE